MMDENNTGAIYEFGKEIIIDARDSAIRGMEAFLKGTVIGRIEKKIFKEVKKMNFDERQQKIITLLVAEGIDAVMHSLFVNFDESFDKYKIIAKDKKGNDFNIVTESDGLPLGYYEFIDEFSKYKSSCDIVEEDISDKNWKLEKDSRE